MSVAKLILVHPPSPVDAGMFDAPQDDPGHAPWVHLRMGLASLGYEIRTSYRAELNPQGAEWVLFMNVPAAVRWSRWHWRTLLGRLRGTSDGDFFGHCLHARLRDRLGLFLWEPQVVLPENYDTARHRRFARVFTWCSDLAAQGGRYRPIVWPQPSGMPDPAWVAFDQRKLLVNFSGNKQSGSPLELYSARVDVIRHMETHHPSDFDHYGPGWDESYPSWRGVVSSKFDVYPKYRFGLCYENMHSVRGYITEKIFDCLRSGTVPVYWGTPDIETQIDPAAFVDRRQFGSTSQLVEHLTRMSSEQWGAMREAGQRYLASEAFARFLPPAFFGLIRDGLGLAR